MQRAIWGGCLKSLATIGTRETCFAADGLDEARAWQAALDIVGGSLAGPSETPLGGGVSVPAPARPFAADYLRLH